MNQSPKRLQPLGYTLAPGFAITDPEAVLKSADGGKDLSRRDADVVFEGALMQLVGVDLLVHFNPERKAALGTRHPGVLWKIFREGLQITQ